MELLLEIKAKQNIFVPDASIVSNDVLTQFILYNYIKNPQYFNRTSRVYIENAIKNNKFNKRWADFTTVVERLNAPKLIEYYENKNFRNQHHEGRVEYSTRFGLFKNKV